MFRISLIAALSFFVGFSGYGQNKLVADVVIDSLAGTKDELFSKSKMFVAEYWNSSKDVIKNEDSSAGVIFVKGISRVTVIQNGIVSVTHSFKHSAKIYHKDNRTRFVFEISPSSTVTSKPAASLGSWSTISDINKPFEGPFKSGVTKKAYAEIQQTLGKDLRAIVADYEKYMQSASVIDEDW